MKLERFRTLVDAYGADPVRWPARERGQAEALLAVSAPARAALAEAAALDRVLAHGLPATAAGASLRDAIRRATHGAPQRKPLGVGEIVASWLPGRMLWPNLAGLAAALALGMVLGAADIGMGSASPQATDDLAALLEPLPLDSAALYGG